MRFWLVFQSAQKLSEMLMKSGQVEKKDNASSDPTSETILVTDKRSPWNWFYNFSLCHRTNLLISIIRSPSLALRRRWKSIIKNWFINRSTVKSFESFSPACVISISRSPFCVSWSAHKRWLIILPLSLSGDFNFLFFFLRQFATLHESPLFG